VPDFTRIINLAYERILGRPPDPGGLQSYNEAMNAGLTEAAMRESLLRSSEYAERHPDPAPARATKIASKPRKKIRGASTRKGG
jgi:hypothetical protein